eukprot:3863731-Prymnesium_polylepis.1
MLRPDPPIDCAQHAATIITPRETTAAKGGEPRPRESRGQTDEGGRQGSSPRCGARTRILDARGGCDALVQRALVGLAVVEAIVEDERGVRDRLDRE